MSESEAPAADWYTDPSGRFEYRYWDGTEWTGHVSTEGKTDWDPPGDAAAAADDATVAVDDVADHAPADAPADVVAADAVEDVPADAGDQDAAAAFAPAQTPAQAPDGPPAADDQPDPVEDDEPELPADHNLAANLRADVDEDVREWLDEVAEQVGPRLSRINREWTSQPQAEAAKACAYGLLVGHLAKLHPHMRPELSSVAEVHESFSTLEAGQRLQTLTDIAGDPERTAAWLGPLIGESDSDEVAQLFD